MIALFAQAAAEYVGVMISNGVKVVGASAQDIGRWAGDHPVEIGVGLFVVVCLARLRRRRGR